MVGEKAQRERAVPARGEVTGVVRGEVRTSVRGERRAGKGGTRSRILEAAAALIVETGGADLSVAQIARGAEVFPNQVTYHFGSKDSLLVQAAFLAVLHDIERLEVLGRTASNAAVFTRSIARVVLTLPSLPAIAQVLAAGTSRPDLAEVVDTHIRLLFRQSENYLRRLINERGWMVERTPALEVRTFWSAALGATLLSRAGVAGTSADLDLAGTMTIHD